MPDHPFTANFLNVAHRRCSKSGCDGNAVSTLTYIYADSMAVLGPLATFAEPHAYDLCIKHSERLTAPRGWDSEDDLLAIANAVREAAKPEISQPTNEALPEVGRRGHLRVLPNQE
jgi:hypothetical protein